MTALAVAPAQPVSLGPKVIRWIEAYCVIPDGPMIGQPFRVPDWWGQVICEWYEMVPDGKGGLRRRYSQGVIGVPKKNIKTSISAAMALYELIGSEDPAALVISAASTEDQGSNLLFGSAKTMVEMSPDLRELSRPMTAEIIVPSMPRARMKNITSKAGSQDGPNARAIFCDELHEWAGPKGEQLFTVLEGALVSRPDATLLAITTAGHDEETICYRKYQHGKRVLSGEVKDPRFYSKWVEAPAGCDYRDRQFWIMANPLFGITVHESVLEDRMVRDRESAFRRFHLNQWVSGEEIWIPSHLWDACSHPDIELDHKLPIHVGIDVGIRHDSTAVAIAQRIPMPPSVLDVLNAMADLVGGAEELPPAVAEQLEARNAEARPRPAFLTVVRTRGWENPYAPEHPLHDRWMLNIEEIEDWLIELRIGYPAAATTIDDVVMAGPEFAYDPAFFERSAQLLESGTRIKGGKAVDFPPCTMVEFPQTDGRMIPASQALFDLIVEGALAHDGDETFKRHILSATADEKGRGAWRLSKPKGSRRHIDRAVATAIAVQRAQQTEPQEAGPSIYETRGLRTL